MQKKETIWRYLLFETLEKKKQIFTQKDIAAHFHISTSTVFHALKAARSLGAVSVTGRNLHVRDIEKLLLLWATLRKLEKDIHYATRVNMSIREIEGIMPPKIIFAAFSAYRLKYNDAPADYDQVYVYAEDLTEIKKRFPLEKKGTPNLYVLKPDPYLHEFGLLTPDIQTFVDLWNIPLWYSKDYIDALKKKLFF